FSKPGARRLSARPLNRVARRLMPERQQPGRIVEIKGVVIDVVFPEGLPEIYTAVRIDIPAQDGQEARTLIAEVQQHLGDDRVRAVRSEEHTSELQSR